MAISDTADAGETRFFSFPTEVESIVNLHSTEMVSKVVNSQASQLYSHFEEDFLYFPESGDNLQEFLNGRYRPSLISRNELCDTVFSQFDTLIDTIDWQLSEDEVIDFFWYRAHKEMKMLEVEGLGADYISIAEKENAGDISKYMMSQFALDYLTEASPLARMLPGTFGPTQMAIFKIVSDEYGSGVLEDKHSVLFQNTLRTLGMSDRLEVYRPDILPSVYMYMCYVNRIATDKRLFLRFLGFLFVYEACLIYPTQQQGRLLKQIFGEVVDTAYFDLHVEIDQGHGVWCVEKMLVPMIKEYGVDAAREILRGYHETLALLSVCDFEMMKVIDGGSFSTSWNQ